MKIWNLLVNTPHDSLVDLEDEDNANGKLVLKRYYKHASDWCHYIEYDERLLTEPSEPLLDSPISTTHDYYCQAITNAYRDVPD